MKQAPQDSQKTDDVNLNKEDIDFFESLGKKTANSKSTVGRNKYEFLKAISPEKRTEEQNEQIKEFEKQFVPTEVQLEKQLDYWEKIYSQKPKQEIEFTSRHLWDFFKVKFLEMHGKKFEITETSIKNIEPLLYYFAKDERFFKCENLSQLSKPSFDKGLLIVGGYGNGKTSVMMVLESIFRPHNSLSFKSYTANDVVLKFEKCIGDDADILRTEFEKVMFGGVRYFDDVKTERIASNFGKVNIFKEIIETRYNRKAKTHITCNYPEDSFGNLDAAVEEFGIKYGGRVYDRIFEMFNIIEFKGGSFRQ